MSQIRRLRAQVTERLTAAAHEICALFERTIAEYEEELSRSKEENQRKQRLLDSFGDRAGGSRLFRVQTHWFSPESRINEETPETPQIKEEAEEQSLKQEQEALPEFTAVCVKSEEQSSLLQQGQTEPREEAQGELCGGARAHISTAHTHGQVHSHTHLQTHNSSDTDCDEEPPASTSTAHMETEADHREHYDQGQGKRGERGGGGETLECPFCQKGFTTKHNLEIHTRVHTGEKSYRCPICRSSFVRKLWQILEKKYDCLFCGKRFPGQQTLKKHIRVHTGEKPYSCSICQKKFAQKYNVSTHMMTHTGEKPFSCSVCNKKFAKKGNLATHMRIHTGERPFSCSVCDKTFAKKANLEAHGKTHSDHRKQD
uniref:C2H2-type domain-containing protein n=1 Tax=Periophthalmus magnuspinnatus TaxID=409849 RepID=A0A3B3ZAU8_9GOBI